MTKRALLEKALRIKEREYGLEHREVATLTSLGNAYGYLGDAQVMRDLLKKAVCIQERVYGPGHRVVAHVVGCSLGCLGSVCCCHLGEARRGRDLLEKALCIQERVYGPGHRVVATILTNLGNAYGDLGRRSCPTSRWTLIQKWRPRLKGKTRKNVRSG